MQNQVIADIEIEDEKIDHYSSVFISQKFNEHHSFSIRIKYNAIDKDKSYDLSNAQKLIGKSVIIKLLEADTSNVTYEFHGLVCEINFEQSDNFTSDLVLKGYSPTILLENGPNSNSFYNKTLSNIADTLTKPIAQANCTINNKPQYSTQINYISQYRESAFHFLNRLSSQFGEWFYYDGQKLYFGKPASSPNIEVTYGGDVQNLQIKLRILPLTFSGYSYNSKNDTFISSDAPSNIDGLDQYASHALKESNNIFSEPVNFPVKQRIESKSDLDNFLKQQKTAMAANLEVLSATSTNPSVCIGAIADVKISALTENGFNKQDGGKFLVTGIEHNITANGKYYNNFEGIPSGIDVIPVTNTIIPLAEPQIATVTDNKDPENMGRVRVQMLWQQSINEKTDWLRVMTPDAGGGKNNPKNRGLVLIPEVNDQVLVCFRYNDPDRPFVLGSIFEGKTGAGGGDDNKVKTLTTFSGSVLKFEGDTISIIDASTNNKILFDGKGKIDLVAQDNITLTCGNSSVSLQKDGTIKIDGKDIKITGDTIDVNGNQKATLESGPASFAADGQQGNATMQGTNANVKGSVEAKLNGGASTTVSAGAKVAISGAIVTLN